MNCISWTVGHLAWHEQRYWLERSGPTTLSATQCGLCLWRAHEHAVAGGDAGHLARGDARRRSLSGRADHRGAAGRFLRDGKSVGQSVGSALQRVTYHYWYHIGEIQAIRQMLGHADLPEYVGDIEDRSALSPGMTQPSLTMPVSDDRLRPSRRLPPHGKTRCARKRSLQLPYLRRMIYSWQLHSHRFFRNLKKPQMFYLSFL